MNTNGGDGYETEAVFGQSEEGWGRQEEGTTERENKRGTRGTEGRGGN